MNVIFISPNFPDYYYNFCNRLKERGVNVLGIGDADYESLPMHTIDSVSEYYKVSDLKNYDEVREACRFYTEKYGKIDWIESQNEYWLETEAKLRSDFDIHNGTKFEDLTPMKSKSEMKNIFKSCGIPVARFELVTNLEAAKKFVKRVGYPVIVKPDNGVGACNISKINNLVELNDFFTRKDDSIKYIMEEFVYGHVETFDGIADSNKNILISSSHVLMNSILNSVNENDDMAFYLQDFEGKDIETVGRKVVEAFDTRSKFFHFEFFRLEKTKKGLGKKGDLIALEVNMRAPGAYIPDMINYAYDTDVYTIWADMLIHDKCFYDLDRKYFVGYASRRNSVEYAHSMAEIFTKYQHKITKLLDVPEIFANAMGDKVFLFRTEDKNELLQMMKLILKHKNENSWFDEYVG